MISAYWVCAQEFDVTHNTATAQQTQILQQLGTTNPNPWKQFICNLIQQLQEWCTAGKEIILGMDANEDVNHSHSDIMHLFNETNSLDLHTHCYLATPKPVTHQHGSHPMDLIAGTPMCALALCGTWILPSSMPPTIKGDHHLLGLNFDTDLLFGSSLTNPMPTTPWGINSNHELHVLKFCKETIANCSNHHIMECIKTLKTKLHLSDNDLNELENIDSKLTQILVLADHWCHPLSSTPWSLTIQTAYLCHCYWSLQLMAFQNQKDFSAAIQAIEARIDPAEIQQIPGKSLSSHLCQTQKKLKEACHAEEWLCKEHLKAILNQALAAKQHKKSQALKYLICAKCNWQCYSHFWQHTKPKSAGGLTYINIMNKDGATQSILRKEKLEEKLLEHSWTHFAQVEGSPFTVKPLGCLLQYDGLMPFGNHVTKGQPLHGIHNFDELTTAILLNLKQKIPLGTNTHTLNYETLLEGIKKWLEHTTTSPSGQHQGIYKALGKHVKKDKKESYTETTDDPPIGPAIKQGHNILYAIFDIMLLAIHHKYPLQQWKMVWTLFIEKELGNPHLNRLCCIMIFKANWQLLLKWNSSYGFLPKTEVAGTLVYAQGGSQKGLQLTRPHNKLSKLM